MLLLPEAPVLCATWLSSPDSSFLCCSEMDSEPVGGQHRHFPAVGTWCLLLAAGQLQGQERLAWQFSKVRACCMSEQQGALGGPRENADNDLDAQSLEKTHVKVECSWGWACVLTDSLVALCVCSAQAVSVD